MQPFKGASLTTVVVMRVILKLTEVEEPKGLDSDRHNVQRPLEAWPVHAPISANNRDSTGALACQIVSLP